MLGKRGIKPEISFLQQNTSRNLNAELPMKTKELEKSAKKFPKA